MKLKDSYNALVIVGAWNIPIFTPEWIGKYIFPGKEISIEFPEQPVNASLRFTCDNVSINIVENRLIFKAHNHSVETFNRIEEIASNLCRCLAHTPVLSFGINHIFECTYDEIREKNIFTFMDDDRLAEAGYDVDSVQVHRTINFQNHKLNVIWTKAGESVTIEFNNHYKASDIQQFLRNFEDSIITMRMENAIEFLKKIYSVNID